MFQKLGEIVPSVLAWSGKSQERPPGLKSVLENSRGPVGLPTLLGTSFPLSPNSGYVPEIGKCVCVELSKQINRPTDLNLSSKPR